METEGVFKIRELSKGERVLSAPNDATGYYTRETLKNCNTGIEKIIYTRVA